MRIRKTGKLLFTAILILLIIPVYSQYQKIGGVINSYSAVLTVNENDEASLLEVKDPDLFSNGDKVLIIQMKGAEIDTTNTENFGKILDLKEAGNFEYASVRAIIGFILILDSKLKHQFDVAGKVQVVKIPEYKSCVVVDELTAKPWNGETGGVLSFHVAKTLFLEADINVSGKGFRGGNASNNPDGFCNVSSGSFHYPLENADTIWLEGGAMKGEGIAEVPHAMMAGKGALANGGGGGNKHNAGGGGGANFTSGGKGGNEIGLCEVIGNGGFGGWAVPFSTNKIFMGGGGGCGDFNDDAGTPGANGGGVVLIQVQKIVGNRHFIKANGASQIRKAKAMGDGAGGGGAGGTILLDVEEYEDSLFLQSSGGDGGSISENALVSSFGPGGGGGAGVILMKYEDKPGFVTTAMGSGESGLVLNSNNSEYKTGNGATAGVISEKTFLSILVKDENLSEIQMEYEELIEGNTVVLDKVQFLQGKYLLTVEAMDALEDLAKFLREKPEIKIELAGHTDNVGSAELNYILSENRVKEVKKFLIDKGVQKGNIITRAYGGSQPIASNKYLETRKLNRRVELKIIQ